MCAAIVHLGCCMLLCTHTPFLTGPAWKEEPPAMHSTPAHCLVNDIPVNTPQHAFIHTQARTHTITQIHTCKHAPWRVDAKAFLDAVVVACPGDVCDVALRAHCLHVLWMVIQHRLHVHKCYYVTSVTQIPITVNAHTLGYLYRSL